MRVVKPPIIPIRMISFLKNSSLIEIAASLAGDGLMGVGSTFSELSDICSSDTFSIVEELSALESIEELFIA
tara:strand:+ start:11337 stop:11552 length:216 start_codon:yes stop_codon:yes gene_type:complete